MRASRREGNRPPGRPGARTGKLVAVFCLPPLLMLFPGLLIASAPAAATEEAPLASLEDHLARFLQWFPGRYDSALQTRTDVFDGVPENERNYRRHSIFRRVDLPAFGDVVFYAEQYRDGDPSRVYRQRLYEISLDPRKDAIRLRVHVPPDVESLRGAYRNPELLGALTPEDTTVWAGCDLWWRWQGDHFRGELEPGACRFTSEAFAQEIVLEEYLLLGPDSIQFADRGLSLEGRYLFGMQGESPNHSRRVRPFLCELEQGETRESGWLHDQGGMWLTGAGPLRLQRWNDPEYARGLRLTLEYVVGYGSATAVEAVDAQHIDLVLQDLRVRCEHAPDRLYDDRVDTGVAGGGG